MRLNLFAKMRLKLLSSLCFGLSFVLCNRDNYARDRLLVACVLRKLVTIEASPDNNWLKTSQNAVFRDM